MDGDAPKPTLDERLEALTQTVEIMASEGRRLQILSERNERRWQSQDETNRVMRETIVTRELRQVVIKRAQHTDERIDKLIAAIGRLIRESEEEEADGEA